MTAHQVFTVERNVRDRVRNSLRASIISGELAPGELYPAPGLAARFGVSATPVREAMYDLVNEGLVIVQPNKGFRITEVSDADLDDVTAVRLMIEPPAVRDVVAAIPAADFSGLRGLADRIVSAAAAGDLVSYVEADRVFHLTLLGYSGNGPLVEVVSRLRAQTRLMGLARLSAGGRLTDSAREHHELLDLMGAGEADATEALMRRHLGHIRGLWSAG